MYVEASLPFETQLESGVTGLVGTIAVKVIDNDGGDTIPSTTANIAEVGSSGVYVWNVPFAPGALGQYTIIWSLDGTYDFETVATEDLVVVPVSVIAPSPIPSPDSEPATVGPCTSWLTGAEVADCCSAAVADVGTFTSLLDDAADAASQILYELSGRQFAGLCSREGVRPCHGDCGCGGFQVLSRGHIVGGYPYGDCGGRSCWCQDLSRVKLAGYVREVTQVKLDGVVLDASVYRVDEHRYLTRVDGGRWPSCSNGALADTEEGTFSVSYTFGRTPPLAAIDAAAALACQIYLQCSGSGADCDIPTGATRITRQGITIERALFTLDAATGSWRTGVTAVDYFLNTYNRRGLARRAVFASPGSRGRYARPVG